MITHTKLKQLAIAQRENLSETRKTLSLAAHQLVAEIAQLTNQAPGRRSVFVTSLHDGVEEQFAVIYQDNYRLPTDCFDVDNELHFGVSFAFGMPPDQGQPAKDLILCIHAAVRFRDGQIEYGVCDETLDFEGMNLMFSPIMWLRKSTRVSEITLQTLESYLSHDFKQGEMDDTPFFELEPHELKVNNGSDELKPYSSGVLAV